METILTWQEKLRFEAEFGPHKIIFDTAPPLGTDLGPSPKRVALATIGGCAGIDVISILTKQRQKVDHFQVHLSTELTDDHPKIFKTVKIDFKLKGEIEAKKALEAARLSMTKYCGVSAMFTPHVPIVYEVWINDQSVGSDRAQF